MSGIEARFRGTFGAFTLDASFSCPGAGVTGLFGPSGCGKTTILRCLAGLTRVADGDLKVAGEVWQSADTFLPPHKRPVGYVFQDARLFPHLSVLENLEYGLRRVSECMPDTDARDAIVELLGIENLLTRAPVKLSGGERQRVALGRALLARPRLLLMDEPMSALDRDAKREILPYLEKLAHNFALPIIYVSHDLAEIERLADRLIVMNRTGEVAADGPLSALLTDLSLPIARLPDAAALLTVTVARYDDQYDLTECRIGEAPFFVPGHLGTAATQRRLRVEANDVSLVKEKPAATSVLNVLPAHVVAAEPTDARRVLVLLAIEGGGPDARLLSSVTRKSWDELRLAPGDPVFAQVKGMAMAEEL